MLRLLRRPLYRRALLGGVAAAVEHEAVPFTHSFRTVLDVGAHRGQFALFAATRFPEAALVCFEPQPQARRRLRRALPGARLAALHETAVAAQAGEARLHVSARSDSSSLLPIGVRQVQEFPGTQAVAELLVRTERLDAAVPEEEIRRPTLLKLDVQGYELEALRGATGLLHVVDEVLVECSFAELYEGQPLAEEIERFLEAYGFSLAGEFSLVRGRDGRPLQADLLFRRREPAPAPRSSG